MLHLLQEIFEQVIVPEAVWREIASDDASKAGVQELQGASWIERRSVTDVRLVHLLRKRKTAGDSHFLNSTWRSLYLSSITIYPIRLKNLRPRRPRTGYWMG